MNTQYLNQLTLTHGDIQVSPTELQLLNQQPLEKYEGATGGYAVLLTGYSQYVRRNEQKNNIWIDTLLSSLSSMPRPIDSARLRGSVSTFSTKNYRFRADYQIHSGQVHVFNIQLLDEFQELRNKLEKPALYKMKKDGRGVWQIKGQVSKVSTSHAAVNGQSNNLAKATWIMGSHLNYEFKQLSEYTLFHNPSASGLGDTWESMRDKLGLTTPVTKHFATVLQQTQAQDQATCWLGHSQGGIIFAEGVRQVLKQSSSNMGLPDARKNPKIINKQVNSTATTVTAASPLTGILNKQSIVMHGNANNNWRSSQLFERAGIEVKAIRAHDFDIVTNIIGANSANPRKLLGSVVYANHVKNGSVAQSPHTTMQSHSSWLQQMESGPGQGRGPIQSLHHNTGKVFNDGVKVIKNYLK